MLSKYKSLKIKPLRYSKPTKTLDKILLAVLFIFLACFSYLMISALINDIDFSKLKLNFKDGRKMTPSEEFQALSVVIAILVPLLTTIVTVFINFFMVLLNNYPKYFLSNDIDKTLEVLLNNIPIISISDIQHDSIIIHFDNNLQCVQGFSYYDFNYKNNIDSVSRFSSKLPKEDIVIPLNKTLRIDNEVYFNLLLDFNNYYKYVAVVNCKIKDNNVEPNTFYIKHYYVSEKNLKKWCEKNEITI